MTTDKSKINKRTEAKLSKDEVQRCITTLEKLVENGEQLVYLSVGQRNALLTSAGRLSRPDQKPKKKIAEKKPSRNEKPVRQLEFARLVQKKSFRHLNNYLPLPELRMAMSEF
jgi:hypothetical protein